jgi:tRNA(Leu) C34 or U34 (ribose-2'-O)-methylase TrmL
LKSERVTFPLVAANAGAIARLVANAKIALHFFMVPPKYSN